MYLGTEQETLACFSIHMELQDNVTEESWNFLFLTWRQYVSSFGALLQTTERHIYETWNIQTLLLQVQIFR
jgi:hypothetical protein